MNGDGRPSGRWALWASGGFFALFVANIVLGRILISSGEALGTGVSNALEFLLLFAAIVLFVVAILIRERDDVPEPKDDRPPLQP